MMRVLFRNKTCRNSCYIRDDVECSYINIFTLPEYEAHDALFRKNILNKFLPIRVSYKKKQYFWRLLL